MKDDRGSPVGVGVLTVLTVLLVLTLAVFSALTYTGLTGPCPASTPTR